MGVLESQLSAKYFRPFLNYQLNFRPFLIYHLISTNLVVVVDVVVVVFLFSFWGGGASFMFL